LPLVGKQNVSVPSEREVVESQFNNWLANKRLVLIHEIYAGQSQRAYNDIKSYMTEKVIRRNKKYEAPYEINNCAAFVAASNSTRALHMAQDDRRWFVPGVTKKLQPLSYWTRLNEWLRSGGLEIILWHLQKHVAEVGIVAPGTVAPMTAAKAEMIEDSKSEGQRTVAELGAHAMAVSPEKKGDLGKPLVLVDDDVRRWLADQLEVPTTHATLESLATIRNELKAAGMIVVPGRWRLFGRKQQLVANFAIREEDLSVDYLRPFIIDPAILMPKKMGEMSVAERLKAQAEKR
jgi:hypothetical protein